MTASEVQGAGSLSRQASGPDQGRIQSSALVAPLPFDSDVDQLVHVVLPPASVIDHCHKNVKALRHGIEASKWVMAEQVTPTVRARAAQADEEATSNEKKKIEL